jgi:hypothetical protein
MRSDSSGTASGADLQSDRCGGSTVWTADNRVSGNAEQGMRRFVRADRSIAEGDVRLARESFIAEPGRAPTGGNRTATIGEDRSQSASGTDAFARRNRLESGRSPSVAARGSHTGRFVLHDQPRSRNARSDSLDRNRLQRNDRPRWPSVVSRVHPRRKAKRASHTCCGGSMA